MIEFPCLQLHWLLVLQVFQTIIRDTLFYFTLHVTPKVLGSILGRGAWVVDNMWLGAAP